jgi:hypothetical protein
MDLALLAGAVSPRLPSGPYWLVYANCVHYLLDVPPLSMVPFGGVNLSDKLINYAMYAQACAARPARGQPLVVLLVIQSFLRSSLEGGVE